MKDMIRLGFAALVLGSAMFLAMAGIVSTPRPTEAAPPQCENFLGNIQQALASGRGVTGATLQTTRDCILSGRDAESALQEIQDLNRQNTPPGEVDETDGDDVLASFQLTSFICLDFNDDGSLSSEDDTFHVLDGGYLGNPYVFSVFSYTGSFYLGGFSAYGLTVGPFIAQWISFGAVQTGIIANC